MPDTAAKTDKTAENAAPEAAAKEADKTAKTAAKHKTARQKTPLGLLLFAAGLSGGIIALIAGAYLAQKGARPPAFIAPPAAAAQAEMQAYEARLNARLAENARSLTARLDSRFEALAAELQQAAQTENAAPSDAAEIAALQKQIEVLQSESRARRQAAELSERALIEVKDNLSEQAAALRAEISALAAKRQNGQKQMTQLLALQNFQNAFDSGAPYAAQLQVFNAAFPHIWPETADSAAVSAALARYQDSGLPDKALILAEFTALADRLAAEDAANSENSGAEPSFWQKAAEFLSPWLRVRPQGETQGSSPAALLAQTEAKLAKGEDKAALAAALKLPAPLRGQAEACLAPLSLRLAANAAFTRAAQSLFPAAKQPAETISPAP